MRAAGNPPNATRERSRTPTSERGHRRRRSPRAGFVGPRAGCTEETGGPVRVTAIEPPERGTETPMSETPYVSLSEAAKIAGRSKSTLSKALASGKMSYVSKDPGTGAFAIDPAEALRVFPRTGGGGFRDRDRTGANGGSGNPPIALESEAGGAASDAGGGRTGANARTRTARTAHRGPTGARRAGRAQGGPAPGGADRPAREGGRAATPGAVGVPAARGRRRPPPEARTAPGASGRRQEGRSPGWTPRCSDLRSSAYGREIIVVLGSDYLRPSDAFGSNYVRPSADCLQPAQPRRVVTIAVSHGRPLATPARGAGDAWGCPSADRRQSGRRS